jgi:hypothetical protein
MGRRLQGHEFSGQRRAYLNIVTTFKDKRYDHSKESRRAPGEGRAPRRAADQGGAAAGADR